NVAGNAIMFSPPGETVELRIGERARGGIEILVADRGPGIDAEDIPTILEPFRQAEATVAYNKTGSGLGLPLVKRLTELHGGQFVIESGLGKGTRALVRLPAALVCGASPGGKVMAR
ncbi:MAG: ATP-binding protein, partial [Rhodovibrionaceae bacterium]